MPTKGKLVHTGMWGETAQNAVAGDFLNTQTAAGTTQATALVLSADNTIITTTASGTGALLRVAYGTQFVANAGANTLVVYPPVGGTINGLSANTGINVPTTKSAVFMSSDSANFIAVIGA